MTQADEDEELELGIPGTDEEPGDDIEDLVADGEVDAEVDAVDEVVGVASDEDEDDSEDGAEIVGGKRGKREAVEPVAVEDVANIEARRHAREQLESDVEAFLSKGGKIVAVAEDLRADPPKKPESKYGTRSI